MTLSHRQEPLPRYQVRGNRSVSHSRSPAPPATGPALPLRQRLAVMIAAKAVARSVAGGNCGEDALDIRREDHLVAAIFDQQRRLFDRRRGLEQTGARRQLTRSTAMPRACRSVRSRPRRNWWRGASLGAIIEPAADLAKIGIVVDAYCEATDGVGLRSGGRLAPRFLCRKAAAVSVKGPAGVQRCRGRTSPGTRR